MNKIGAFFSQLTNNNSLTSGLALLISFILLSCAQLFWNQQPDTELLFLYLLASAALMVIYAACYGFYTSYSSEFEPGLISARFVICVMGILTCLSFLWSGFEMQKLPNVSDNDRFACLVCGLGVYLAYVLTYAAYAANVGSHGPKAISTEGRRLFAPGRFSIKLMKIAICLTLLACGVLAAKNLDPYAILQDLAALIVAFIVCTFVEVQFTRVISREVDRGV